MIDNQPRGFQNFTGSLSHCKSLCIPENKMTEKITHTGDKASLNRCGQQHRYRSRVTKNTPKPVFFEKRKKIMNNAKTQKRLEICQNQQYSLQPEVSNPSGSVVSRWTKNTQKPKLFEKLKKILQNAKTQKRLGICQSQRYALRPEVSNPLGSVVSTLFCRQKQYTKKTFFVVAILDQFQKKCSNLKPLLCITFPQGFQISKNIGHPTLESGGKKTYKRYLKSEQTDGQTDRQRRCFENPYISTQITVMSIPVLVTTTKTTLCLYICSD